jgi:hypothetical protein
MQFAPLFSLYRSRFFGHIIAGGVPISNLAASDGKLRRPRMLKHFVSFFSLEAGRTVLMLVDEIKIRPEKIQGYSALGALSPQLSILIDVSALSSVAGAASFFFLVRTSCN